MFKVLIKTKARFKMTKTQTKKKKLKIFRKTINNTKITLISD